MYKIISELSRWAEIAEQLHAGGYRLWQMQYRASDPEGFHAWFWRNGRSDAEIVTYNAEVQRAIIDYEQN